MTKFVYYSLKSGLLRNFIRHSLALSLIAISFTIGHGQAETNIPVTASSPVNPDECPDASAELKAQLREIRSLSASFRQQVNSIDGYLLQDMKGEMQLAKPGLIHWKTLPPFEQELVADGEKLWLYDPDLEQVTVKPVGDRLSDSPAALLLEDSSNLSAQYRICRTDNRPLQQGTSISLKPLQEQSVYSQIVLSFSDSRPTSITMRDRLGQTTLVTLSNVLLNPELDSALFVFQAPEGVDIFQDQ